MYILEKVKEAKAAELGENAYHINSNLEYSIDYNDKKNVETIQQLVDTIVSGTELTESQKQQIHDLGLDPNISPQELLSIIRKTIPQQQIEQFAERMQVSPEFIQFKLNEMLARIIEKSEFTYKTNADTLLEILLSGKIKNGHETGTSSLGIGDDYFTTREYIEGLIFQQQSTENVADKPVYGMAMPTLDSVKAARYYLQGAGCDIGYDSINDTPRCVCIFKKNNIIDSTTITSGDSINYIGNSIASQASNPQLTGTFPGMLDQIETYDQIATAELTDLYDVDSDSYLEIQLHGEKSHGIDMIDKVVFIDKAPSTEVMSALADQGIGFEVLLQSKPQDVSAAYMKEHGISYSYIGQKVVLDSNGKPIFEGNKLKLEEVLIKVEN